MTIHFLGQRFEKLGNAQRPFHAAGTSQILTLNRVTPLQVFIVLRASRAVYPL